MKYMRDDQRSRDSLFPQQVLNDLKQTMMILLDFYFGCDMNLVYETIFLIEIELFVHVCQQYKCIVVGIDGYDLHGNEGKLDTSGVDLSGTLFLLDTGTLHWDT